MAALWSRARQSTRSTHGARSTQGASDEALIRSLYEEHGGALLAYATRLTGDRGLPRMWSRRP